jgi:hypothetical protein
VAAHCGCQQRSGVLGERKQSRLCIRYDGAAPAQDEWALGPHQGVREPTNPPWIWVQAAGRRPQFERSGVGDEFSILHVER